MSYLKGKRMSSGTPGFPGIVAIVGGIVVVSILMSALLDMWTHWPLIILAIIVSFWAIQAINK